MTISARPCPLAVVIPTSSIAAPLPLPTCTLHELLEPNLKCTYASLGLFYIPVLKI
ncbi:hypothetical protein E2C01_047445 [Portunus trituberculatus]|uniref:Uncharacterized protein n=1 Tax=Portunus trituberculatus TaxID=210409 RepID=A0A5B7G0F9_PORTR|nr:hypothetical protein [Portunus trituberculatus]